MHIESEWLWGMSQELRYQGTPINMIIEKVKRRLSKWHLKIPDSDWVNDTYITRFRLSEITQSSD